MNKGKKHVTAKLQKQIRKEVHQGMNLEEVPLQAPSLPLDAYEEIRTQLRNKKAALKQKLSKRTSSKEGVINSIPSHVHKEGLRWTQSLQKQTALQSKRLTKKSLKSKM